MILKAVRHAQSQANVKEVDATRVGDHNVEITDAGARQAYLAGNKLNRDFFITNKTLVYLSPYTRTRQTLDCIIETSREKPTRYEDPRLREVEWGYDKPENYDEHVEEMRKTHGKFYFRMQGGESPADGYDRVSGFLETMMRQIARKKAEHVLIVSHGLTIRCFVMRFMHLTVEQFDDILNPRHCDIITISDEANVIPDPQFTSGKWRISGLRLTNNPGTPAWPRKCKTCTKPDVWPNMPNRQARCESCGETIYYDVL